MRRSAAVALAVAFAATLALPVAADPWRSVPGARRLVRPGAAHVTLEVRSSGGSGCGGGGCNGGVELRNVRGAIPSEDASHFYSDRPGREPGCFARGRDTLFEEWSEIVIAPARAQEEDRPSCGIMFMQGSTIEYWVILRTRRARTQ